jgi:hypothetical protein
MHKKFLVMALAGLALPALASASTPRQARFEGRMVPVRETVQVTRTPAGIVRVRTWTWKGPGGTGAFQISESRGPRAAVPGWALAQMRRLQLEMGQMRRIETALAQPLMTLPPSMPVVWSEPMVIALPGPALPLDARIVEPVIVRRVLLPAHVIEIIPAPSAQHMPSRVPASGSAPGLARHLGIRI